MKSWPKVTKVDPKNHKNRPNYILENFSGGTCDWGTTHSSIKIYDQTNLNVYLNFTCSCVLYGKSQFIYFFYCIKHHKKSLERAETLTDFSRSCNNNDASVCVGANKKCRFCHSKSDFYVFCHRFFSGNVIILHIQNLHLPVFCVLIFLAFTNYCTVEGVRTTVLVF